MRSIQSIVNAQSEARYISRNWSSSKPVEAVEAVSKIMPTADSQYGSQANKDAWYKLEVRAVDGGKLFTPEIAHEANKGYNQAMGTEQFQHHFNLFSNPEELIKYIDRVKFIVQYKGEIV